VAKGGLLVSLYLMGFADFRPKEFDQKDESSEDEGEEATEEDAKDAWD